jgi:hypothetical protein
MCVGDFNDIINLIEKRDAAIKPNHQMEDFKSVLNDSQLSNLGFQGPKFT